MTSLFEEFKTLAPLGAKLTNQTFTFNALSNNTSGGYKSRAVRSGHYTLLVQRDQEGKLHSRTCSHPKDERERITLTEAFREADSWFDTCILDAPLMKPSPQHVKEPPHLFESLADTIFALRELEDLSVFSSYREGGYKSFKALVHKLIALGLLDKVSMNSPNALRSRLFTQPSIFLLAGLRHPAYKALIEDVELLAAVFTQDILEDYSAKVNDSLAPATHSVLIKAPAKPRFKISTKTYTRAAGESLEEPFQKMKNDLVRDILFSSALEKYRFRSCPQLKVLALVPDNLATLVLDSVYFKAHGTFPLFNALDIETIEGLSRLHFQSFDEACLNSDEKIHLEEVGRDVVIAESALKSFEALKFI